MAETAKHVKVRRVSADKAYSGTFNVAYVATLGAVPLLPFKANAPGGDGPMTIWRRLFHVYSFQRDTFLAHYHKRSNVETTFSMMKAKFGDGLRSKSEVAQCNEAFLKEPCHNICCVIQSTHELGSAPTFWQTQAG